MEYLLYFLMSLVAGLWTMLISYMDKEDKLYLSFFAGFTISFFIFILGDFLIKMYVFFNA